MNSRRGDCNKERKNSRGAAINGKGIAGEKTEIKQK